MTYIILLLVVSASIRITKNGIRIPKSVVETALWSALLNAQNSTRNKILGAHQYTYRSAQFLTAYRGSCARHTGNFLFYFSTISEILLQSKIIRTLVVVKPSNYLTCILPKFRSGKVKLLSIQIASQTTIVYSKLDLLKACMKVLFSSMNSVEEFTNFTLLSDLSELF